MSAGWIIWAILNTLTTFGVSLGLQATGTEQSLLQRSEVIADASSWVAPYYTWISPRSFLAFIGDDRSGEVYSASQLQIGGSKGQQATGLDDWTNHQKRILWAKASPNGKWIAWDSKEINLDGPTDGMSLFALKDNHFSKPVLHQYNVGRIAWTPDSKRFIEIWSHLGENSGIVQGRVCSIGPSIVCKPFRLLVDSYRWAKQEDHLVSLGIISRNRMLVALLVRTNIATSVHFLDFSIEDGGRPPHHLFVTLPLKARVDGIALSTDGKRFIWNLAVEHHLPPDDREGRRSDLSATSSIWVSGINGSKMRCLGSVEINPYADDGLGDYPEALSWIPNRPAVSFIYRHKLYMLNVK